MSRAITFIRSLRRADLWPGPHRPDERLAGDLDDEIAFHLESTARRLIAEGHAPETAWRLAEAGFGDVGRITPVRTSRSRSNSCSSESTSFS